MSNNFAVLPANGYQLIRIDENDSEPVETRLSEPENVLGFLLVGHDAPYFSIQPVTLFGVYDEPRYALICPDGKIYLIGIDDLIFQSLDDLKQHLRRDALALYKEFAAEARKSNCKDAASFSRVAKKLQKEINENE